MSLQARTAAGSLVAILQSIAAGLTAGTTIGNSVAGATIMGTADAKLFEKTDSNPEGQSQLDEVDASIIDALSKLFAQRLDSNPKGQFQLDEFAKVYDEGDDGKSGEKGSTRVVFEIRDKLHINDEAFDSFLEIFTLAYNSSNFLWIKLAL
ncbi:hypothetical protein F8M41_022444 [Gigaspora margarita]|uniref:EF-hand domain-containing protein n=1 Tax=Gigaspora margarita TaxID=4874 RepID=A0A8H4AF14_GIGMA|nr:hypothetical protein F8M41_022444 [Gigaspora margarita]